MYLKRITLDGFKTFAEKATFEFKRGFTVITGPNGCGKSNVVDAIKWTLGEQRAKSLRGKEMQDVIFGGNENRPAASYAEVTMIFSVAKGDLSIEGNELSISRRLNRQGESTYMINRQAVRLKDVRDLFLDTGVGAAGYYVMEQGKIDYILNAGPEDRRVIFEEAAGISKFKTQKKETLRKLEHVDTNLARLLDILGELEGRLKTVKTQATKAQKYKEYNTEIRRLKMAQAAAQYKIYREKQAQIEERMGALEEELQKIGSKSQEFDLSLSQVSQQRKEKEALLDQYQREALTLTEKSVHLESIIENDQKLLEDMAENKVRSQEEQKKNRLRIQQIQEEKKSLLQNKKEEEKKYKDLEKLLKSQEDELSVMEKESQKSLEALDLRKKETLQLLHQRTEIQNELAVCASRLNGLEATKKRIDQRMEEALQKERELLFQRDQKEKEFAGISEEVSLLQEEEKFLSTEIQKKKQEEKELARQMGEESSRLTRIESRIEVLGQVALDDLGESIQLLLKARDEKKIKGLHDLLINLLSVDLEFAVALEAALDKNLYGFVVENQETVERVFAFLKDKKAAGALLLPLQGESSLTLPALPKGVTSPGQMVKTEGPYKDLLQRLLASYGLVQNWDEAQALQNKAKGLNLVTPAGEVIYAHGAIQIGSSQKEKKSTLAQRSELNELQKEQEVLKHLVEQGQKRLKGLSQMLEQHQSHLEQTKKELSTRSLELVRIKASLQQMEERLVEQRTFQENCNFEWNQAHHEAQEAERKQSKSQDELKHSEKISEKIEKEISLLEKNLQGVQDQRKSRLDKITTTKVEIASLARQIESLGGTIQRLEDELSERKMRDDSSHTESQSLETRRGILQKKIEENILTLSETKTRLSFLSENISALEEEKNGLLRQEEKLKAQGESSFNRFQSITEEISSLKVQKSKVDVRLEDLLEKVKKSLDIDLPQIMGEMDLSGVILEEVDEQVNELSRKLKNLGNVNFEALEELKVLEERYSKMKEQEEDLLSSKNSLDQIIQQLDSISRERFEKTFSTIRGHFQNLFRKLFGGGKADLILEEGVDQLEAGIDIIAKPPGKEPRSITLLSGGEKTMTTVALSFAIFQFKPSPFCVLDEVDAALDENNIGRFLNMLEDFVQGCQFIIISHSRQTIGAASIIYGVTMEESGVSRNLSLEFKQITEEIVGESKPTEVLEEARISKDS